MTDPAGRRFPDRRLRWLLRAYALTWLLGFPLAAVYFLLRGLRDRRYLRHLEERLGFGSVLEGAIWIHAVSLGEVRSAGPLVRRLAGRGEDVLITCLTPAGRQEADRLFRDSAGRGRVLARYPPLEISGAWRRFLRSCRPSLGLVLEFEIWPVMIMSARRRKIPLYLCNTQITTRNLERSGILQDARLKLVEAFSGAFAKSELHAGRLRERGVQRVHATGELRFDQPVPELMTYAADRIVRLSGLRIPGRPVITLTSVVEGEDDGYLEMMRLLRSLPSACSAGRPLFVYVPRAPERFGKVARMLAGAGLSVLRRSEILNANLALEQRARPGDADVLLGDSLGEMPFYIALADLVVAGGGFVAKGAHNVIEPLAQKKPVFVGPHIWTIEYPAREAIAAGILNRVDTADELATGIGELLASPDRIAKIGERAAAFRDAHSDATSRTIAAIDRIRAAIAE